MPYIFGAKLETFFVDKLEDELVVVHGETGKCHKPNGHSNSKSESLIQSNGRGRTNSAIVVRCPPVPFLRTCHLPPGLQEPQQQHAEVRTVNVRGFSFLLAVRNICVTTTRRKETETTFPALTV